MSVINISCFTPIEGASLFKSDIFLPPNEIFTLEITYPLSVKALFPIKTGKKGMGTVSLIGEIGKAYQNIYSNEDQYGIWGHDIGDLSLEGIRVDTVKKVITISVGS